MDCRTQKRDSVQSNMSLRETMQLLHNFLFNRCPKIVFGPGEIVKLVSIVNTFGKKVLIVRGTESLKKSSIWKTILSSFEISNINFSEFVISGEPSPQMIDNAVRKFFNKSIDCVLAIGGGSVLDAGKAISAMLPAGKSVIDFLEIVGNRKPSGKKVPFIAVPTTSGTGSEASANAVLSEIGASGFKSSLRHENYVPDVALIDPLTTTTCPPNVTAACGMDALTQLLESLVSPKSSPFTDSLISSALPFVAKHLINAFNNGATDIEARTGMSYASLVSGISLGNAGLGVVHGLASIIGGHFPIPHGVICGTLVGPAVEITIYKLKKQDPHSLYLEKYAAAGRLLTNNSELSNQDACNALINYLKSLAITLCIPLLSDFGITKSNFNIIPNENCNKNNPVQLDDSEIKWLLSERIR